MLWCRGDHVLIVDSFPLDLTAQCVFIGIFMFLSILVNFIELLRGGVDLQNSFMVITPIFLELLRGGGGGLRGFPEQFYYHGLIFLGVMLWRGG